MAEGKQVNDEQHDDRASPDPELIAWAKQQMEARFKEAAALADELGLPPSAKYSVMGLTAHGERESSNVHDTTQSFAPVVLDEDPP